LDLVKFCPGGSWGRPAPVWQHQDDRSYWWL